MKKKIQKKKTFSFKLCVYEVLKRNGIICQKIFFFMLENKASKLKAGKKSILTKSVYKSPGWEGKIQQVFISTISK